jgi:hypothetical protein
MNWTVDINDRRMTPYSMNGNKVQEFIEDVFRVRNKFNGSLVFINNVKNNIDDYTYIKTLDKSIKHTIIIKQSGNIRFSGEFSYYACEFFDDEEKVIFTPETRDDYTVINEGEDIEVNVILNDSYLIEGKVNSYLTFKAYYYYNANAIENPGREPSDDLMPERASEDWVEYWKYDYPVDPISKWTRHYRVYAQERIMVQDYREMDGWTELDEQEGLKLYGRSPSNYDYPTDQSFAHVEIRPKEDSEPFFSKQDNFVFMCPVTYLMSQDFPELGYIYYIPISNPIWGYIFIHKNKYNGGQYITDFSNYYQCYKLKDCLQKILSTAMPDFTGEIKSTLLFFDHAESAGPDFYTNYTGHDYVTGRLIKDKYLIEKSDFKRPYPSTDTTSTGIEPASIGNATFKKLVDFICLRYQAKWFIDSDGNLRIEHISYKTLKTGIDISTERTLRREWKYINEEIPNRQIFSDAEGWSEDWTQKEIVYGNIPVLDGTKEKKEEFTFSFLCTDVDGANQHLTELSDEGFVFIEAEQSIFRDTGSYSGKTLVQNAGLSIANCLYLYYRHNAYKQEFTMFGEPVTALSKRKLKKQDVTYLSNIKPKLDEVLTTNLGAGEINSLEIPTSKEELFIMEVLYD